MEAINKVTGQVAYSTREQSAGGRQIVEAVENMNRIATQVNIATKEQASGGARSWTRSRT